MADPMPRADGDDPPADPKHLTCEFCDCRLTSKGEVLRFSARAKELRTVEDRLERANGTIAERDATIADLKAQLSEALAAARKVEKDSDGDGGLFG